MTFWEFVSFCVEIVLDIFVVCIVACVLFVFASGVVAFILGVIEGIKNIINKNDKRD